MVICDADSDALPCEKFGESYVDARGETVVVGNSATGTKTFHPVEPDPQETRRIEKIVLDTQRKIQKELRTLLDGVCNRKGDDE